CQLCHFTAITSGKTNRRHPHPTGSSEPMHQVFRVATCGNSEKYIAFTAERNNLTSKNICETNIVRYRGHHCYIVCKTNRRQCLTSDRDRMHELNCNVLC